MKTELTASKRKFTAKLALVILIILLNPFVFSHISAQTVLWADWGVSQGFENGNAVAADDSGNVYVTGQFEYTTQFGTTSLYSDGSHDIFVAKYSSNGDLKWIKKAGGFSGDIGLGIGIDAAHNVYITGEIEDTVQFAPNHHVISNGSNDIFLAKYDAGGNFSWAKGFGSDQGSDKGRAIAVSPSGNCYVTGNFTNTTAFDNITLNTNGGNDIFVTKISTTGNVVWAKKAGGSNQDRGYGIAIDADENVFVTGAFAQTATFKNTTINGSGKTSTFIAKYDSSGSFRWVRAAGACCDTTKSNSIALDAAGNIYIAGSFNDATEFDNYSFSSAGMGDVFVTKYTSSGNVVWAKHAGSTDDDGAYGIAIDNNTQTAYVTGMLSGTSQFGNLTIPIAGYRDVFIAAYDLNGDLRWVNTHGGNMRDIGLAIAVSDSGYIYTTGLYNGNAMFGTIQLTGYPNEPWAEFYVDKIAPPLFPQPAAAAAVNVVPANCFDLSVTTLAGSGNGRMIIARQGSPVSTLPSDGIQYHADSSFGAGTDLGNGNFIVYDGSGTNITVTGLAPATVYYFTAVEYSGYGMTRNYNTVNPPAINMQTSSYAVNIAGLQASICQGDTLSLSATGAAVYNWSPSAGLSSGNTSNVQAFPSLTTNYTVDGTTAGGCPAHAEFMITVKPSPSVSLSQLNPVCVNGQTFVLNNGSPAGGFYSGPAVVGGQFYPYLPGTGTTTVRYDYTAANGCTASATSNVVINPSPVVSMNAVQPLCQFSSPVQLTGNPAGGIFSGNNVSGTTFNPLTAGNFIISYTFTDANGCSASSTVSTIVNAVPSVSIGNDTMLCAEDFLVIDAGSGFSSYLWSNGSTNSSVIVDSSGTGLGTKNLSVQVTNASGCRNTDSINVTFDLCAGIHSPAANTFSMFPNPFQRIFTISTHEKIAVTIFDVNGRKVIEQNYSEGEFAVGEKLASGSYYVRIISVAGSKVVKLIKL